MPRVRKAYEIVYPNAIKLRQGAEVHVLRRESKPEWRGWLWCEARDGQSGWISETHLDIRGDRATLKVDYDAREVSLLEGETVEILKEENGWSWVKKADASEGWVPSENLA